MPDLMESIKATQDRVTKLLQKGMTAPRRPTPLPRCPPRSNQGTSFGQEFNRLKAGRLQEENAVLQNLMGQKRLENETGNLDMRRQEFERKAASDLAARGDKRYKAIVDTTDMYKTNPKFGELWQNVSKGGDDKMTAQELTELVHAEAAKLGISPSDKEPIEVAAKRARDIAEAEAVGKARGEGAPDTPSVSRLISVG